MENLSIRPIDLRSPSAYSALEAFLTEHGLKLECDIDSAFGVFSEESDELLGCGGAAGSILKCFAISPALRGQNCLGLLITQLVSDRFSRGFDDLFVITRPHNLPLFSACGFYPLAQTEHVLMLENRRDGIARFLAHIPRFSASKKIGAIVANCNPITKGHLALIRHAASQCDSLYLFVVQEDRSYIPFADRYALVQRAVEDIPDLCVCPSGPYMISGLTFPTYFLKEEEDPSVLQSELDIALFARHIAPTLGITIRFAGEEPTDPVTRTYNSVMRRILPQHGIAFCELPRVTHGGIPISASNVRSLVRKNGGQSPELRALVPPCTADYLSEHFST